MKIEVLQIPQMLTYRLKVEHEDIKYNVTVWIDREKPHKFADWEVEFASEAMDNLDMLPEVETTIIEEIDRQWNKLTMS